MNILKYMQNPIRCGGLDYFNGRSGYRINGHFVPISIIKDCEKREDTLNEWIEWHDHKVCKSYLTQQNI